MALAGLTAIGRRHVGGASFSMRGRRRAQSIHLPLSLRSAGLPRTVGEAATPIAKPLDWGLVELEPVGFPEGQLDLTRVTEAELNDVVHMVVLVMHRRIMLGLRGRHLSQYRQ